MYDNKIGRYSYDINPYSDTTYIYLEGSYSETYLQLGTKYYKRLYTMGCEGNCETVYIENDLKVLNLNDG